MYLPAENSTVAETIAATPQTLPTRANASGEFNSSRVNFGSLKAVRLTNLGPPDSAMFLRIASESFPERYHVSSLLWPSLPRKSATATDFTDAARIPVSRAAA